METKKTRGTMEVDVLYVGAGPASLASALRLKQLVRAHNEGVAEGKIQGRRLDPTIVILEKAPHLGAHILSGAVLDPRALTELVPNFKELGAPVETAVRKDGFYFLTRRGAFRVPLTPPQLSHHGNYVISLAQLVQWLGAQVQKEEVDIFLEFPGQELLFEEGRVVGVKTGEKGIGKRGEKKENYEPGINLKAKVTLLAEGAHGSLTKSLIQKLHLSEGKNPQVFSAGVKEIWEVPEKNHEEGGVFHTMGFPLKNETFGGGFIYHAKENKIYIGFVVGLDYRDPLLDPQEEFQKFKSHPFVKKMLEGGKPLCYGAKTIPEGGYFSLPRYYGDGFLILGDSAGFLNALRLKGIHLAMKSGMLAAEAIFQALLKGDFSSRSLRRYEELVEKSWIKKELWKVRNFHQGFKQGMLAGMLRLGFQLLTGGRDLLGSRLRVKMDYSDMEKTEGRFAEKIPKVERLHYDGSYLFDKRSDLIYSGTKHDEDQPPHLVIADYDICNNRCKVEYGNPCQYFCPANVYEIVEDEKTHQTRLILNAANCVHCKTCDIKDPYQIINWITPEGGGGPNYRNM